MQLKTTMLFAIAGVLASTAGAFAIPVSKPSVTAEPWTYGAVDSPGEDPSTGAHITRPGTLALEARLGHASLGRGSRGETYLFAQVGAADLASAAQPAPLGLALVIDRSGSMKGPRIANAISAASLAIERLRDGDTVTVVAFDTTADVIVPPTRVSAGTRSAMQSAVRSIRLGGDTCISCGMQEAMRQLQKVPSSGEQVNRMLVLSDGATNAGVKDAAGLRAMAGRMHAKGVTISTIGVEVDFDEKVMAAIATEGNGRHHFVEGPSGLPAVFAQEFDDLLASVAKEAELVIEPAPGVEIEEIFDRGFRREGSRVVVPFGTFSARQDKTVLVRLRVSSERQGERPVADVKLAYRDLAKGEDRAASGALAIDVRSDGSEQRDLDPFVAARLERSRTAQTLTEANVLFEKGRVAEARAKLASQSSAIARARSESLALASSLPAPSRPARARPLDSDFADQAGAIAKADRSFAAAPPAAAPATLGGGSAGPATSDSREGKASVRKNQQAAVDLAF